MHFTISFPAGNTDYYLNGNYSQLLQIAPVAHSIIISDQHVYRIYGHLFSDYRVVIIEAGEQSKNWETIHSLAEKLAVFEAHKTTRIVAVGGGVVTDIVGFLSSVYMRGVDFSFVPTSLLAMIDASIGGKNGINLGQYKNMLGTIRQPKFILYDASFLDSLPTEEWSNGFAEIIKYACIGDPLIFEELGASTLTSYKIRNEKIRSLIARCVQYKNNIVLADEQEQGLRKILNFGHTAGHAFETIYHLHHGQAVGLGMLVALIASEQQLGLNPEIRPQLTRLLEQYGLPALLKIDVDKVLHILKRDKKRMNEQVDFILLKAIGSAVIHPMSFDEIRSALQLFADEYRP